MTDTSWDLLKCDNVDIYAENITKTIVEIAGSCIPNKNVCIRSRDLPWLNNNIKKKIRQRKRLYRKAKQLNSYTHWSNFRRVRNDVVLLLRNSKNEYFNNIARKLKSSDLCAKDWWKTLRTFIPTNTSSSIPPLLDEQTRNLVANNSCKADMLNRYFASQCSIDESNHDLPPMSNSNDNSLQYIHITQEEVIDSIKCLKLGKASGPDGIDNRILKEAMHQLSYPLCDLFNSCLNTQKMPSCWKIANVCPIFKKGDPSLASNYRPISLLNTIEKVFERILHKHIFNFLRANSFFAPTQSGFLPGDSTVNQLTYIYDTFCRALDNGLEVRVVFFDISKAFDKVWHRGVLYKLQQAGIRGNLLSFLSNYLTDRKQKVIIPGAHSSPMEILAGVPQGSILGPLMFLVYINDIIADIQAHIHLFADDTSLFMVVNSPNETAAVLQADIDKISSWADKWLVSFSPSKSESMLISRKIKKNIASITDYDKHYYTECKCSQAFRRTYVQ